VASVHYANRKFGAYLNGSWLAMREAYGRWTREKTLNGYALGIFILVAIVFVWLLYFLSTSVAASGESLRPLNTMMLCFSIVKCLEQGCTLPSRLARIEGLMKASPDPGNQYCEWPESDDHCPCIYLHPALCDHTVISGTLGDLTFGKGDFI